MSPIITIPFYDNPSHVFNFENRIRYVHIASLSDQTSISVKVEIRNGKLCITSLFHQYGMQELQATAELIIDMQPPESIQVQCATSENDFVIQGAAIMVNILISIHGPTITLLYNVCWYTNWLRDTVSTDTMFTHTFNYV
jgi:hypothetical protein